MGTLDLTSMYNYAQKQTTVTREENTFTAGLTGTGVTAFSNKAAAETVHGAYLALCMASAGQQTAKMQKVYEAYQEKCNSYQEVCKLSQWAAGRYQVAVDQDKAVGFGVGDVKSGDYDLTTPRGLSQYSRAVSAEQTRIKTALTNYGVKFPGDDKLDKDQWQTVRDGLDYAKNIQSTDMKTLAAQFDQAAKDCDSAQQLATDAIKDLGGLLSSVGKSI
ncbi:hypothetical protein [Desulfocurvus sp. DL9XJH121]